ncbi:MAG: hypothetical protein U0326_22500 [Polyangiales bacterium]
MYPDARRDEHAGHHRRRRQRLHGRLQQPLSAGIVDPGAFAFLGGGSTAGLARTPIIPGRNRVDITHVDDAQHGAPHREPPSRSTAPRSPPAGRNSRLRPDPSRHRKRRLLADAIRGLMTIQRIVEARRLLLQLF